MSALNDIKESKSLRLVIGFIAGVLFTQYFAQNQIQTQSHQVEHSLSDDVVSVLIASLNQQKPQALPATVVHCNQNNTIPNTRSAPMVTDEGMKAPTWTPPENPKQKQKSNSGVDDTSTENTSIEEEEDIQEGEEQEEQEIVEEVLSPAAINWPGFNTGQIVPQEVVNTSNGQIGSTTPVFPPAVVDDVLPPEDSNTGSIDVVINRPKKGS